MTYLVEDHSVEIDFCNHYRAAKRRLFEINNSRGKNKKQKISQIIKLTANTLTYATCALESVKDWKYSGDDIAGYLALKESLQRTIPHAQVILDISIRRNLYQEQIVAAEKIVSLFEPDTDIINKGNRESVFGHKVTLTTGASGLITDITVHQGNPADKTLVKDVLKQHVGFYGTAPVSMTFDGCYFTYENKEHLIENGVKFAIFSKEPKKTIGESPQERRKHYCFRAGIEGTISLLKRKFGLTRIFDKGTASFKKAVKGAAIVCNLFVLARKALAATA